MKKRVLLATIALVSLIGAFAQFQEVLPLTVQRFLDERTDRERLMSLHNGEDISEMFSSQFAPPYLVDGVEVVDAFIDIENKEAIKALKANGIIVNCDFDDFVTAQVPVSMLPRVTRIAGVTNIELSRIMELCTDTTLRVTHAGQVINGLDYGLPQGYDGTGVIVGIIDTGFDYQHMAFRCNNDTSKTRIVRVYDPNNTTGHVAQVGTNVLPGSVFMGEQIDTMTTDYPDAHGTHTASIAAGMHVGGYGGMAPGADIVLCSSRNLNIGISETEVANCIKYIYAYADSVGKPCVISVSVSTLQGPHDGTDRISKAVANATGPGRIFVIAAGNNAERSLYCSGPTTSTRQFNMLIGQQCDNADDSYFYKNFWFDTWVRAKSVRPALKYHIFDKRTHRIVWQSNLVPLYTRIDWSEISSYFYPDLTFDSVGYLSAIVSLSPSTKYEIQCYLHNLKCRDISYDNTGRIVSRYAIGVSIFPPSSVNPNQTDSCYLDSWMCTGKRIFFTDSVYVDEVNASGDMVTKAIGNFYSWPNDYSSIGTYAVHDSVISAGAYSGRNSYYSILKGSVIVNDSYTIGQYYMYSSYQANGYGPTGVALPTVAAPGVLVVAAGSRYSFFGIDWHISRSYDFGGSTWGVLTGTSMAAPTVAGIIAQWLQIEPTLSPSQVKNVIAETAIKDRFTQNPYTGMRFGPNGKIDALAGARYLISLKPQPEPMLGDVNDDGIINITDVTRLTNYLLNTLLEDGTYQPNEEYPINEANADYNQDGSINVTDLVRLINHVLNVIDDDE